MTKWYKIIKKILTSILLVCVILLLCVTFDIISAQPYNNIIKYVALGYCCLYLLFWVFDLIYLSKKNNKDNK